MLRLVSALIRLDFPTFERPAKAISGSSAGGTPEILAAAVTKWHSCENNRRPTSAALASLLGLTFGFTSKSLLQISQ